MSKQQEYLESVTERLIKQIENNQASWQRPYEAGNYTGTDVPVNIKGNPYNGMNMLNLWAIADEKGYTDNRWITFNGAKELGAKVKKGEKASDIYYWKFTDTLTANKKDKDGNDVLDEKGKPIKIKLEVKLDKPKVFWAKVFNGDQLEGMPPRETNFKKLEEWERHEIAERILKASGVEIIHKPSERAYYSPSNDHIVLPERSQFKSSDMYYATALHELGHATGHESRLNRDLTGNFGSESYAKEELRAEIASMLIGQELQIGHDPSQHIAYLQSWIKVIKNDPKELFKAVKDADIIQNYVLSLDPQRAKEIDEKQQDQSVITALEKDHAAIKEYHQELPTPLETYQNIKELLDTHSELNYQVIANKKDGYYVLNYFDNDRKTEVTTQIAGGDGKALTSFKGERIEGAYYTNDTLDQRSHLTAAFGKDIAEQIELVKQAQEQLSKEQEAVKGTESQRIYINVPFKEKNEAKELGAKWDKENKSWYINSEDKEKFSKWLDQPAKQDLNQDQALNKAKNRTYLYVPLQDKDAVKELGGRYDVDLQVWYTTNKDTSSFSQWLDRPSVPTPEEAFSNYLRENNIVVEAGHPKFDGKAHRLANEQSDSKNVMYQAYMNHGGVPSGRITNFSRDGVPEKWIYPMEYIQKEQMAQRVDQAKYGADYKAEPKLSLPVFSNDESGKVKDNQEIDKSEIYDKTAERAKALFSISPIADSSQDYLSRKGVTANNLVRVVPPKEALPPELSKDIAIANDWKEAKAMRENNPENKMIAQAGSLIVPQFKNGELRSFETIGYQGAKYALKDGEKVGLSLQIGEITNGKPFIIAEGYATGATLHEQANKIPSVIAFGKGGLATIAQDYRDKYPDSPIYLAADNDLKNEIKTDGINTGIQNAVEAAKIVNGRVLIPEFSRSETGKDWNDIFIDHGKEALKVQLSSCLENKSHDYVTYNEKAALQLGNIENGKPFLVANNYLVAKTLHEQTEQPVITLFEKSDNLEIAAKELKEKYPDSKIYFTSDKHADAAKSINMPVLIPEQGKDWHDTFNEKGKNGLRGEIGSQLKAMKSEELGKVEINFNMLNLAQQKPIRNFVFTLESTLKDNPEKLHQALNLVNEKIPEIASGKINIAEALQVIKQHENKDYSR